RPLRGGSSGQQDLWRNRGEGICGSGQHQGHERIVGRQIRIDRVPVPGGGTRLPGDRYSLVGLVPLVESHRDQSAGSLTLTPAARGPNQLLQQTGAAIPAILT